MQIFCENWNSNKDERLTDKQTGRPIGVLVPCVTEATLKATVGISTWSKPHGAVVVKMYDDSSVASFADAWERKWQRTYPLGSET